MPLGKLNLQQQHLSFSCTPIEIFPCFTFSSQASNYSDNLHVGRECRILFRGYCISQLVSWVIKKSYTTLSLVRSRLLMNLVLMIDKLVTCLYFFSVLMTSHILAGLTAFLGWDSALRRHILCLLVLFEHKRLVLQAETANKLSGSGSECWLSTYFDSAQVATQVYAQFFAIYWTSRFFIGVEKNKCSLERDNFTVAWNSSPSSVEEKVYSFSHWFNLFHANIC